MLSYDWRRQALQLDLHYWSIIRIDWIFRFMMRTLLKGSQLRQLYSNIKLEFTPQSHSATLTLANQKKRNPLSLETITQIHQALNQVHSQIAAHKLKVLVLRAEGPVFSAGHDLKELKAAANPENIFNECTKTMLLLKRFPIITLCAIDGVAAAAGFQMALGCDLIVATQKSTFSTPGIKWGLFCSTPGVQLVRAINSQKKANEMLLFGEPITAAQALQYGLINKVTPHDQLDAEVNSYIAKANKLSGEVLALGKRVLSKQVPLDLEQAYCVASEGMRQNITEKEDCREGLTAFAEKRHPHFKH